PDGGCRDRDQGRGAGGGGADDTGPDSDADSADGPRPLRRRVRGATLRTTVGAAQTLAQAPRTRDAEAERDALDEFEAAVERARRESDTGSHERPRPHIDPTHPPQDQNHLPEGAEQ
ncbi:hypothetical protein ABT156_34430, partial [Streptomyces sp. NPDC001833]